MKRVLSLTLPWLLLIAIGVGAGTLRYGLVESADVAHTCEISKALACTIRHLTVEGFIRGRVLGYQMGIYGWVALAAAALALTLKSRFFSWLAAATGLVALMLYCFAPGAFALLVGCLRLVRLQSKPAAPFNEHRAGEGQVQAQP
jgi:hypothetical protein